jgi:hypothetical protein
MNEEIIKEQNDISQLQESINYLQFLNQPVKGFRKSNSAKNQAEDYMKPRSRLSKSV